MLISAIMAGFMLSACGQDVQSDLPVIPSSKASQSPNLPPDYKPPSGSNNWALTASEEEEFETLQNKLRKLADQQDLTTFEAWEKQDPATRGPQPIYKRAELPKDERRRLNALEAKLVAYNNWINYKKYVPEFLSQYEAEELVILRKEQLDFAIEQHEKYRDWLKQDGATRKPWPKKQAVEQREKQQRISELDGKISLEKEERSYRDKLAKDMRKYHVAISKTEQRELITLNTQKNKLTKSIDRVREEIQNKGGKQGLTFTQSELFNKTRHLIVQRHKIDQRMDGIYAPLKTTKEAEQMRNKLTRLSQQTDMLFLSGELEEAIALNAEKLRLTEAGKRKAMQKWIDDETYEYTPQSINETTNIARIKEIDARFEEITAPMVTEARALIKARNPDAYRRLLEHEKKLEETLRHAK